MRNYVHTAGRPTGTDRTNGAAVIYPTDTSGRTTGPARVWPNALAPHLSPCRQNTAAGIHQHRCSTTHAAMVETYRGWRDLAYAAAEEATSGYATELAEYWTTHPRPTFGAFLAYWHGSSSTRP